MTRNEKLTCGGVTSEKIRELVLLRLLPASRRYLAKPADFGGFTESRAGRCGFFAALLVAEPRA